MALTRSRGRAAPICLAVTTVVAALTVLSGCGTNQQDATPSETRLSTDLAPRVDTPLDADAFVAEPCASLSDTQRTALALVSATSRDVADGVICEYRTKSDAEMSVFYSNRPSGLNFVYRMNEGGAWGLWEPTEVDGYPAVAYNLPDHPDLCSVAVGLSDSLYFSANADADSAADRCSTAKSLAAAVLSTIKTGR
jgi:Protein of unknown function (DUF3558)